MRVFFFFLFIKCTVHHFFKSSLIHPFFLKLCTPRGFILLSCWMNQSATELNKNARDCDVIKVWVVWVVLHYYSGGTWTVDFREPTIKMIDVHRRHQWQTVTVQPQSLFTVIGVSRTIPVSVVVWKQWNSPWGWDLTLLCNLWVKPAWVLSTLVAVRLSDALELTCGGPDVCCCRKVQHTHHRNSRSLLITCIKFKGRFASVDKNELEITLGKKVLCCRSAFSVP